MAKVVTSKNEYDFEPIVNALERAYAISQCMDEVEGLRAGKSLYEEPRGSALTVELDDAIRIVRAVQQDELEEKYAEEFGENFERVEP